MTIRNKITPFVIGLSLVVLAGCATTVERKLIEKPVHHPIRPVAVQQFNPKWKVIVENDNPFVAMSYSDSVRYRIWLEDLKRYIATQNSIICSYRASLNEPECNVNQKLP